MKIATKPDPKWRTKYDFLHAQAGATLEALLFERPYCFSADVTGEQIIDTMLVKFGKKLTPELRESAASKNRTLFRCHYEWPDQVRRSLRS